VRVHARDHAPARRTQTDVQRLRRTLGRVVQEPHARVGAGDLGEDRRRAVLRASVDEEKLDRPVEPLREHRVRDVADDRGFVAHRYQDADVHRVPLHCGYPTVTPGAKTR
jgi:hypothetical protein